MTVSTGTSNVFSPEDPQAAEQQKAAEAAAFATGEKLINEQEQAKLDANEAARKQHEAEERTFAGKFNTAEDLEKAYLELQKKLGEPKPTEEPETEPEEPPAKEEPKEEAKEEAPPEAPTLSDEEALGILERAGGKETYENALKWAGEALGEAEQTTFNQILATNNPQLIEFAVRGLVSRFKAEADFQGQMLTGKNVQTGVQGYKSAYEFQQALQNPEYHANPLYRAEVEKRLMATDPGII
jgi:hypothetical protein